MTTGYCCKCKSKREMKDVTIGKTTRNVPMARGLCSVCGCKMCKIGKVE